MDIIRFQYGSIKKDAIGIHVVGFQAVTMEVSFRQGLRIRS